MGLCNQRTCGCAIVSSTLSVTGSGTGVDPWVVDQPLSSSQLPYYTFASTAARDLALPSPAEGQLCWIQNVDEEYHYTGAAWQIWYKGPTSFTPVLTGFSAGGAGGVNVMWYSVRQGAVHFKWSWKFGSGGSMTGGSVGLTLPLVPHALGGNRNMLSAIAYDGSAGGMYPFVAEISSGSAFLYSEGSGVTFYVISATNPFTWAIDDEIWMSGVYDVA